MVSLNRILATSFLIITVNACSPKDSNSSAAKSSEESSKGSIDAKASKLNAVYAEQSSTVNGVVKISCTSVLNGVKVEKSTKAECDVLKAASSAASSSTATPTPTPSPTDGAVNGQTTCSYVINGVKTEKNNAADCAVAEAAFKKEAAAAEAAFEAELDTDE